MQRSKNLEVISDAEKKIFSMHDAIIPYIKYTVLVQDAKLFRRNQCRRFNIHIYIIDAPYTITIYFPYHVICCRNLNHIITAWQSFLSYIRASPIDYSFFSPIPKNWCFGDGGAPPDYQSDPHYLKVFGNHQNTPLSHLNEGGFPLPYSWWLDFGNLLQQPLPKQ